MEHQNFNRKRITVTGRSLVIAALLVWWLACWLVTGIVIDHQAQASYHLHSQQAQQFVADAVPSFNRILTTRSGVPRMLARDPEISATLARFGANPPTAAADEQERRKLWSNDALLIKTNKYLQDSAQNLGLDVLNLLNANGDCVASSSINDAKNIIGTNYSDHEEFLRARAGQPGYLLTMGKKMRSTGLNYYAPVMHQGRFVGVVSGGNALASFSNLIKQADAYLSDINGVVMLARDPSLMMHVLPNASFDRLDAAARQAQYQSTKLPTLQLAPWGHAQFPELLRVQGRDIPAILRSHSVTDGGLILNVLWPMPELLVLEQQRMLYTGIVGVIGTLLILLTVTRVVRRREQRSMTQALVQREHEFRSLAANLPVAVIRYDCQCRRRYLNPAAERMLHGNAAQLLGLPPGGGSIAATPVMLEYYRRKLEEVLATGQTLSLDLVSDALPAERQRHYEVRFVPEYDTVGKIVGVLAIWLDITERKHMQDQLAQRERDFRSLADNMPDNVTRWDVNGCYLYLNPVHERTLGAAASDMLGKPIPDSHVNVKAAIAQVVSSGQSLLMVHQPVSDENGDVRLHDVSIVPERDETGKVVSVLGIGRDMTEIYRMQEAIATREQAFRSLAESSPDFIVRYDHEGRHLYFNDRLLRQVGLDSAVEALGKRPGEVWPDGRFAELEQVVARAMESGCQGDVEIVQPTESGAFRYHQIYVVPERDASGQVVGAIAFGREITTIREAERKLTHFIDNLPGMAFTFRSLPDGRGRFPYVSPAIEQLYGLKPEDVKDDMAPIHALAHPDDRPRIEAAIAEAVRTHMPMHIEFRVCRPGLPERWLDVRSVPEHQADGSLLWYGLMIDITERKQAQVELQRGEHELRRQAQFQQSLLSTLIDAGVVLCVVENGKFVYTNDHYLGCQLGYAKGQMPATVEFIDLIHPDDRPRIAEMYRNRLAGKPLPSSYEIGALGGDGSRLDYEFHVTVVPDSDPVQTLVFALNIAERKRLENELKQRETEYRALAENLPDPVFRYDRDCLRIYVNPAAVRITGLPIEQLIGNTPENCATTKPENAGRTMAAIREVFATGERRSHFVEYLCADGSTSEYQGLHVPEFDANGQVVSVLTIAHEVTSLRAAERRAARFFANMPGFAYTFVISPEGHMRFPFASQGIHEIFGLRPEDVRDDVARMRALAHPADWMRVEAAIIEASQTLQPFNIEARMQRPGHPVRWIECHSIPERQVDGVILWHGIMLDITERKQMETRLREQKEFQDTLLNALNQVGLQMMLIENDRIVYVSNHKLAAELGYSEAYIGSHPFLMDIIHPDDRERIAGYQLSRMAGQDWPSNYELGLVTRAGQRREFETSIALLPGTDPVRLISIGKDISERKRMQEMLRDSYQFLYNVIDTIAEPIFVKDRQHRWLHLNDAFCRFIGHSREELVGKSDFDFFPEHEARVFWAKDEEVFTSEQESSNEEEFTNHDGEVRSILTRKKLFTDGSGQPQLVGIIFDLTDRKRYEAARDEALAQAVRLAKTRSEFMAHMSHELRTPLNGILGYTQILQRDTALNARHVEALAVMRHSGEHLLALIEDILDLTRIEAGRLTLDVVDISLAAFLRGVADIVSVKAQEKGIGFTCDFSHDLPANIQGDEKRLRQVLLNLLANAVKFTHQGRVALHVSRVDVSQLAFVVEDTGVGIAAGELESIFQPFEQSGHTQQRFGGTGLGLSISRQLMRLMGGDIWVESHLGVGSRFGFKLELPASSEVSMPVLVVPEADRRSQPLDGEPSVGALERRMLAPPAEALQALYRLAQLGNMRDILQYAEHIAAMDAQYQPFAAHLQQMAQAYQSKAILAFVSMYYRDASSE